MVTNGGYGGVQLALAHGVPLVVAGNTEEKGEIAARVAAYERPPRADEHVDVAIRKYAKLVGSASEGAVAL